MILVDAVVVGLAAWRVASLLVHEEGPFALFDRLRLVLGVERPGDMSQIAKILSCVWCCSVYVALAMWALHSVVPVATTIMAAMAVAVIVEANVRR